jgi:hypothetical protein
MRIMAPGRSHPARFGIEFSLAVKCFISFKSAPALYRTHLSGQPIISFSSRKPFHCTTGGPKLKLRLGKM